MDSSSSTASKYPALPSGSEGQGTVRPEIETFTQMIYGKPQDYALQPLSSAAWIVDCLGGS
jgi:hypothetical protein